MKIHNLLLALILITSSSILRAEEDTPLEKQMQILARGMKSLSQQIADPSKQQENVTLIESLKQAASTSKGQTPRKTSTIPKADQEKFLAGYRAEIDRLTGALNRVEDAVKAGHYDQANSALACVNPIKKEGHSEFKAD
jgi:soluble cytochrome b562